MNSGKVMLGRGVGFALLGSVGLLGPADASLAACQLPREATASPAGAARWLMANTDRVGFAIVARGDHVEGAESQLLELVYPIKGGSGSIQMRQGNNSTRIVTNALDRFDEPEGSLLFVALRDTPSGAVVSECTMALLSEMGQWRVVAALRDIDGSAN